MPSTTFKYLTFVFLAISICACKDKSKKATKHRTAIKGLYSLGPEAKLFTNCKTGQEYWVADSSAQLELKYWQLVPFEKPNEPAYIEVEGSFVASNKNDAGDAYDSTLVVKKLIKITKEIPKGICD